MQILINRNDNLGDIIYTLQLASIIKAHKPEAKITFLVRHYALALFGWLPNIDATLCWEQLLQQSPQSIKATLQKFDVFINAKACKKAARLAWKAKIPIRIGSRRRYYHWLYCNKRIDIIRKNSPRHEIELNTDLLKGLNIKDNFNKEQCWQHVKLIKPKHYQQPKVIDNTKFNIVIHPASNGNGREWPIEHYQALIKALDEGEFNIMITGSPSESDIARPLSESPTKVINLCGQTTLGELLNIQAHADLIIASGTGPLHTASALGTKTIGLFPPKQALGIKRWGALCPKAINIEAQESPCQTKCQNRQCDCMNNITTQSILNKIKTLAQNKNKKQPINAH